ncbi:hypothetical protein [Ruminococcus sp. HUN007]|uniref:hypothetical protein n=1 Tax=Ruminococcus sp. HUN007 TaxID=1514668 RepID=UPI0005D1956D|nr:hypothetical protein [Ruminococcus sp. HUN007]
MKKRICIALAAFMITICAAGCQNSRNIDVTKEVDSCEAGVTEIVPDTTAANAVTEKVSEVGQNGGPPEIKLDLDAKYDESKYLNYVDMPVCKPDANVSESDFKGLWVADVMAKDDTAYDSVCGIPLSATGHLEIGGDGSGKFINITPVVESNEQQGGSPAGKAQGGPPAGNSQGGEAAEGQQKTSEATETELQMTYTFENGVLNASVTIPVGPPKGEQNPDTEKNAGSAAVNNYPHKQMVLQMTDDGRILIQSPDADGTMTSAYYRKTDSFENFDWSSVHFDFDSLNTTEYR